jgi:hypothetical protein
MSRPIPNHCLTSYNHSHNHTRNRMRQASHLWRSNSHHRIILTYVPVSTLTSNTAPLWLPPTLPLPPVHTIIQAIPRSHPHTLQCVTLAHYSKFKVTCSFTVRLNCRFVTITNREISRDMKFKLNKRIPEKIKLLLKKGMPVSV